MATHFGAGKKTKHVELRFLYVQNLVRKYVATDVLQRLKTQLGVVSNWFKGNAVPDARDTDDHVAALNAQCMPRPPARSAHSLHCAACMYSSYTVRECLRRRRRTEVHSEGLRCMSF